MTEKNSIVFYIFFQRKKELAQFFTVDMHETEYRQRLGWLSDNIDTKGWMCAYVRKRETERERSKKGKGDRTGWNKRAMRTCFVHVFHTGVFTSSTSLLQCPSRGRELMLMYVKRGERESIYVSLIKTISLKINYYGNLLLISFMSARTHRWHIIFHLTGIVTGNLPICRGNINEIAKQINWLPGLRLNRYLHHFQWHWNVVNVKRRINSVCSIRR